jgi:hypothetical protein
LNVGKTNSRAPSRRTKRCSHHISIAQKAADDDHRLPARLRVDGQRRLQGGAIRRIDVIIRVDRDPAPAAD